MVSTGVAFVGALFAAVAVGVGYLAYRSGEADEEVEWGDALGLNEPATELEAERTGEGEPADEEPRHGFNEGAADLETDRRSNEDENEE